MFVISISFIKIINVNNSEKSMDLGSFLLRVNNNSVTVISIDSQLLGFHDRS